MERKALIVITSHDQLGDSHQKTGWYLSEVSHIYFPLKNAGFHVDFASPKGGQAPIDQNSIKLDDPINKEFFEDKQITEQVKNSIALSNIDPKDYQIIHFAGGHGTMWDFPDNKDINRITASIYENGGIVAAVCHGPAALVNIKLSNGQYFIDGKVLCSFTDAEEREVGKEHIVPFLLESKLRERGAKFQGGSNWSNQVIVDERLVTGQNPQSASSLAEMIVQLANARL